MKASKNDSGHKEKLGNEPIIVSACLLGINCVFDGSSNKNKKVLRLMEKHLLIPVCPEQLGGLTTPRDPQNITQGSGEDVLLGKARVVTTNGKDVTENFKKGASEVLEIAKMNKVKLAILKENSPACGVQFIYNIKQNQKFKTSGKGVTTALLIKNGFQVISENAIVEKNLNELV
ncbi:MAG: DUF523 domain-containing protein [Candidatus Heimdallarchaeota archaeon]|nr:DUF523 domain-containing protein [Candidatus Heimdallarchaeota archaeon]MBY8994245.1 DUF523 domain-containing protein [Candidatus Heimdallarchaeota archaeon]